MTLMCICVVRLTCVSILSNMTLGPVAKPIRIPADKILDKLSNLITRPTSATPSEFVTCASREK